MDSFDKYLIKLYRVRPKDLDENGKVTKVTPLYPLYGSEHKGNEDYLGKEVDYASNRRPSNMGDEKILRGKDGIVLDAWRNTDADYDEVSFRNPQKRGASGLSYILPGELGILSSGSMHGTKENPNKSYIALNRNESLDKAREDLFDALMWQLRASPKSATTDKQRKEGDIGGISNGLSPYNADELHTIAMIVGAPTGSLITPEDIMYDDYEGWRDDQMEWQLRKYAPIQQMSFDAALEDSPIDLDKLENLVNSGVTSGYDVEQFLKGYYGNKAKGMGERLKGNGTSKMKASQAALKQILAMSGLPLTVKKLNMDTFMKQYPIVKGLTPSDECLKSVHKDMSDTAKRLFRQHNVTKGCME